MEVFSPLEKPTLELFGAAAKANACGRPFVNIAELAASRYHYLVVIELPHVKCYEGEVEWNVNGYGEVTIEGQIDVGDVFGDVTSGLKRRRVQLCPTEPWAVTFYLPGPVEWWTPSVVFTSSTVMELTVRKDIPLPELATNSDMAELVASSLGVVSPNGMDLFEMIAMADTIPPIPPTYTVTTIPSVASSFELATNSDVASSLGVGSPTGMDLFEMIAMADTSTITTTPPILPAYTLTTIPPAASSFVPTTDSDVASSLGVRSPTWMDLLEIIATADIPTMTTIPPMPRAYTASTIPPVSTFAVASAYDVASSSSVNLPGASDIYEMMSMAIASNVASSSGVSPHRGVDIDETIAGWFM